MNSTESSFAEQVRWMKFSVLVGVLSALVAARVRDCDSAGPRPRVRLFSGRSKMDVVHRTFAELDKLPYCADIPSHVEKDCGDSGHFGLDQSLLLRRRRGSQRDT